MGKIVENLAWAFNGTKLGDRLWHYYERLRIENLCKWGLGKEFSNDKKRSHA